MTDETDDPGAVILYWDDRKPLPKRLEGRRFKMARQLRGLSRLQVAEEIGCHWAQIVDLENDHHDKPHKHCRVDESQRTAKLGTSLTDDQLFALVQLLHFPSKFFEEPHDGEGVLMYRSSLCVHGEWSEAEIDAL